MKSACPRCQSKAYKRNGYTRHGKQNHRCLDCGKQFSLEAYFPNEQTEGCYMAVKNQLTLLSIQKIWDRAEHNAFTDLIRYKDLWFCSFRESDEHVQGNNGTIRILKSKDGLEWVTAAYFSEVGVDLRDPKLSITPTGKLMLLCGGTVFNHKGQYDYLQSRVTFSTDGINWDPFTLVLSKHEWLWRLTWHKGTAYGASYSRSVPSDKKQEWHIKLFKSDDGINYEMITQWDINGYPNETTLRFLKSGQMLALVRRDKKFDKNAWLGTSRFPYSDWNWKPLNHAIGGPNFILLPDESIWVAGRLIFTTPYAELEKTFAGYIEQDRVTPLLLLPSGGDCSYPGMVYHEGNIWLSYYSSHEGKASIYLARVAIL